MSSSWSEQALDPPQGCRMVGAMRAFHGIKDGFVVLHSPPGCHSGALLFNILPDNTQGRVVLSGLHTRDLVYGAEKKAYLTMKKLYENFQPTFFALMDCCAAGILGEDLPAMIELAKKDGVTAQSLYFSGAGFHGKMNQGYEEALARLADFMQPGETQENTINLIGFAPDECNAAADLAEIRRICRASGLEIRAVLAADYFAALRHAPQARLNVVLGGRGLRLAQVMAEKFGLPYLVVEYPYGLAGTKRFLEAVCGALGQEINGRWLKEEQKELKELLAKVQFYLRGFYGMNCAVIGDAGKAAALARFLSDEVGLVVRVLAITSVNPWWEAEGDEDSLKELAEEVLIEPDRREMEERIMASGASLIFGSTLEKRLAWQVKAPLLRFSYPVTDLVNLTAAPRTGIRGVATWLEEMTNSLLSQYV